MGPRDSSLPSADSDDEDLAELCRSFHRNGGLRRGEARGASQSPSKASEEEANSSN